MIYERIKSRLLPERSFLYFSYPQPGKQRDVGFYFPMFQNIAVNETQRSRLNPLEILGRSGNLFTFQGAHSRLFKLQFSFNLDHIYHYINELGIPKIEFSSLKNKDRWLQKDKNAVNTKLNYNSAAATRLYLGSLETNQFTREFSRPLGDGEKIEKSLWDEFFNPPDNRTNLPYGGFSKTLGQPDNTKDDSINLLILLINVIRTSTIGNSSNTSLGPPTIYLNHGTMYNNIPCVCSNYSISFDENSTYEIFSLTPKTIKISMDLSENRTGDFGKFQRFSHVKGENLAGWECVIEQGTLDPYNSKFDPTAATQKSIVNTALRIL